MEYIQSLQMPIGGGYITEKQAIKYLFNVVDCIIKPSRDSSAGNGVKCFDCVDGKVGGINLPEFLKAYGKNYLIEKKIKESDNLRKLNPSSCNTLRVHTYRHPEKGPVFMSAYVRIGRSGKVIDNASNGGIACAVSEDGILFDFGVTMHPYERYSHTDSGIELKGYRIEQFNDIISTALKAHNRLPWFNIIGWDMCIDENNNVVIIEFNPDPDMRIEQVVFNDTCMRHYQEDILRQTYKK